MKTKLTLVAIALALTTLLSFNSHQKRESIKIGTIAPLSDHKMKDVSGEEFTLKDLNQENGIFVVFSCNTCPFVVGSKDNDGWENRYNELHETCKRNNIGMVLVNSNEAKRKGDDSFEKMINHSTENKYKSPYLVDKNHKLADAFGASTTPHVFLLNHSLKLVYKGAIDDNVSSKKEVKSKWAMDAINSLGKNEKIINSSTRNSGCSIKRI
jgi:hypothetical protein